MKIEKINNNQAIITLTASELAKRHISLNDIKEGKENVQDFFFEILETSDIIEGFTSDDSQLFVEVSYNTKDVYMIAITKTNCIPNISDFNKTAKSLVTYYTVSSNLYSFSCLDDLYSFCKKVKEENLYIGSNSLYCLDNKYFIFFSTSTIKKHNFRKTFSVISEYSDKYYSKNLYSFMEYATLLISNSAIQTLQKI